MFNALGVAALVLYLLIMSRYYNIGMWCEEQPGSLSKMIHCQNQILSQTILSHIHSIEETLNQIVACHSKEVTITALVYAYRYQSETVVYMQ